MLTIYLNIISIWMIYTEQSLQSFSELAIFVIVQKMNLFQIAVELFW